MGPESFNANLLRGLFDDRPDGPVGQDLTHDLAALPDRTQEPGVDDLGMERCVLIGYVSVEGDARIVSILCV